MCVSDKSELVILLHCDKWKEIVDLFRMIGIILKSFLIIFT